MGMRNDVRLLNQSRAVWRARVAAVLLAAVTASAAIAGSFSSDEACAPNLVRYEPLDGGALQVHVCGSIPLPPLPFSMRFELDLRLGFLGTRTGLK